MIYINDNIYQLELSGNCYTYHITQHVHPYNRILYILFPQLIAAGGRPINFILNHPCAPFSR
jgi:hypothetical protein